MTNLVAEALSSINENLKHKRKSPLYGAFALSWVALNWKPILVMIFSTEDIYYRIKAVEPYASEFDQFYGPLFWASVLIFAMPTLHALYSFFDSWVGSLHDSSDVRRETLNLIKSSDLKVMQEREKAQSEISAVQINRQIAEEVKLEAEARLRAREAEASISKVGDLEDEVVRLREIESKKIQEYADLHDRFNQESRRRILYESEIQEALKAIRDAKIMASNGEHPGMKIDDAERHINNATHGPILPF